MTACTSTPPIQDTLAYSDFISKVKHGQVERVEVSGQMLSVRTSDGQNYETFNPGDGHLIDDLLSAGVQIRTVPPRAGDIADENLYLLVSDAVDDTGADHLHAQNARRHGRRRFWQEQGQIA